MNELNRFDQLVDDIATGRLTLTQIQIAIRAGVRRWPELPEGVKDILCGKGESYAGLIYRMFSPIQQVIGSIELAYRRGKQK